MDFNSPIPTSPQFPEPAPPRSHAIFFVVGILLMGIVLGAVFGLRALWRPKALAPMTPEEIISQPRPTEDPIPHDKDRDGMSDTDETTAGTSDTEFDTDHDSLSDRDEIVVWKTDPVKADTDGDGFPDGLEAMGGFNPLGPGKF